MASADRTAALLDDAGFSRVRTEEVPVHFEVPDAAGYLSLVADTAGPIGLALRGVAATDRAAIEAAVAEPLARFSTGRGYEIPGVACARWRSENAGRAGDVHRLVSARPEWRAARRVLDRTCLSEGRSSCASAVECPWPGS